MMDINTIQKRTEVEGLSFLTKTLPTLGKCLDKALGSDIMFPVGHSFELSKKSPFLPIFLGGFWKLIFDNCGNVADYALGSVNHRLQCDAVRAVRQICFLLYKLEGCCAPDSEQATIDKFISIDRELPDEADEVPLSPNTARALENARMVLWYTLKDLDPLDITPGHGPGALATGEKPWEKMNFSRFYVKLDELYSYPEYFFFNMTHLCDELEILERMEIHTESTAKVVLVPKDSRGPRLISMEPLELQWIQQGLMKAIVRKLENPSSISCGFVNFTDQGVNRALASKHSYYGDFMTADMEDASDRVSLWLVRQLLPQHVYRYLCACRSEFTCLPDGHRIRLKKFAPMGSSVCFPIEAMIFWALAVGSLVDIRRQKDLYDLPSVYVYGDDIIIRKDDFVRVRPVFEELYLKFNEGKCCSGRFFRESCGRDAFKLEGVTPLRVKARWSDAPSSAASLSYISYINSLRERGYHLSADYLQGVVTESLGLIPISNAIDPLPRVLCNRALGKDEVLDYARSHFRTRYNSRLQREEVRIRMPRPLYIKRGESGWAEVLRLHSRWGFQDPFGFRSADSSQCRYTVPNQIKIGWSWVGIESLLSKA
jgi:hypothetical protein